MTVKPSNLIRTESGAVKLLDFGLAAAVHDDETTRSMLSQPGTWMGTLAYAAPEVLSGGQADARSDLYSLGLVLYELAAGGPAFAGKHGVALVAAILNGELRPLSTRNRSLPAAFVSLVERLTARDPADRPESAEDVLRSLESLEGTEPAAGAPRAHAAGLAVLPFFRVGHDRDAAWLGDGLAEVVGVELGRLEDVRLVGRERVTPLLSTLAHPPSPTDLAELARRAAARWVIWGTVQKAGPRLRLTYRLFDAVEGRETAEGKLDGDWDELFALQDRMVDSLAGVLRPGQAPPARAEVDEDRRQVEAFELYTQGRRAFHELSKASLETARERLERALELDPGYALAHAVLGATYSMRYIHRTDPEDMAKALTHLERARELDPDLADPYPWLAVTYARGGDLDAAIRAGLEGVARQPDLAQAHASLGVAYWVAVDAGRPCQQQAVGALLDALLASPRWTPARLVVSEIYCLAGLHDEAEEQLARALEVERRGEGTALMVGIELLWGNLELRGGRLAEARARLTSGLATVRASDHMYREVYQVLGACGLGELELREGRPRRVEALFRKAERVCKEYPRMLGRDRALVRAR